MKEFVVGLEEEVIVIVDTEADAEEMILSLVQEEVQEADYIFGLPRDWGYGKCLVYYSIGYWLTGVRKV